MTDTGFVRKHLAEILRDLTDAHRVAFGEDIDTSSDSVLGHINAVFGAAIGDIWQLAEAVYSSQYVTSATGAALDDVVMMSAGITRLPASPSTVHIILEFSPDSSPNARIEAGFLASTKSGVKVRTIESAQRRHGETTSDPVLSEAIELGPVQIDPGTVTEVDTLHSDVVGVSNPYPAIPGRLRETDIELRTRHLRMLRVSGSATADAIRARLLALPSVLYVSVVSPSIGQLHVVVHGGSARQIAQVIFDTISAGIETTGTESHEVKDTVGKSHTIRFSRPHSRGFSLEYTLELKSNVALSAIEELVEDHIRKEERDLNPGDTIRYLHWHAMPLAIDGVLDVVAFDLQYGGDSHTQNIPVQSDVLPFVHRVTIRV